MAAKEVFVTRLRAGCLDQTINVAVLTQKCAKRKLSKKGQTKVTIPLLSSHHAWLQEITDQTGVNALLLHLEAIDWMLFE